MPDHSARYEDLARLTAESAGQNFETVATRLRDLQIETASWGFADSGTRFAVFPQSGRARTVFERIEDAAEVHRLTGAAPAMALHFPWDAADDGRDIKDCLVSLGLRAGAVNANLFQDPDYKLGSLANPDAGVRRKALDHVRECVQIAQQIGATAQSLWLADGTNYPGQDDFLARRVRLEASLAELYDALPAEQELLLEYKPFEPAFYATDIPDWGTALVLCEKTGTRARVLVDLGHHLHGTNVEQIVATLSQRGRLGGFHFNNRKYADDDLIVGSVNPFELFLLFAELGREGSPMPRLTIDQCHNVEAKVEAELLSVINLQEAYAKSLLIDRPALVRAQSEGDVLGGYRLLLAAFSADVRPLCAHVRIRLGGYPDPVSEYRASGYLALKARERTTHAPLTAAQK